MRVAKFKMLQDTNENSLNNLYDNEICSEWVWKHTKNVHLSVASNHVSGAWLYVNGK